MILLLSGDGCKHMYVDFQSIKDMVVLLSHRCVLLSNLHCANCLALKIFLQNSLMGISIGVSFHLALIIVVVLYSGLHLIVLNPGVIPFGIPICANLSAVSFPGIPEWAFTLMKLSLMCLLLLSSRIHSMRM